MRSSIATYKASLSRLANEVLDAADEHQIPQPRASEGEESPASGRRFSRRRSSRASPLSGSPIANGVDSEHPDEIARYQADILKLQASEAEIRALSVNYAAMLKEKEEQLSKLREENGSLRKSLEAFPLKGNSEKSPSRRQRHSSQENSHSTGNHSPRINGPKQDSISNGAILTREHDALQQNMELKYANSQSNGKVFPDFLQDNIESLATLKANSEAEIKQLRAQLDNQHENAAVLKQKLEEERQLNESSLSKLNDLRMDKERNTLELKQLRKELNEKISELGRLETELKRSDVKQESNISLENAKNKIMTLEKENAKLKIEKDELEQHLKLCMKSTSEKTIGSTEDTEKMALSIRKLEETLRDTCKERDRALQQLARLKQHLLEKELEDSDKMDEDSKMIEELKANCEVQRAHILQLEKALRQEIANQEEFKKQKNDVIQKSHEAINDLKQKLSNCMSIIDSKNVELLNLQTALGQYYAESEAKERLGRDLAMAREEAAKLSESIKVANQELELSKREKEEITAKFTQTEKMLLEGKSFIQKLEEDNTKLRRALEQSMTTLNRMSLDSDNYVDRRIVIKLLVTYFQRNHSKEVLDLMVRLLGFTEEDKQRIGFAQHAAGKGIVRGVLGLPGRVVGGILGGNSPEIPSRVASDNQSFADLWVDFLLKETEEREKRESSEASKASIIQDRSPSSTNLSSAPANTTKLQSNVAFSSPTGQSSINQTSSLASRQFQNFDHPDSEFSIVPLTSSAYPAQRSSTSRLPSKYGL
ncbi:golgin candidate 4 [Canna indica]|uniref:Golgin candidate 4 n=1 Tax=Canna indica TaxID=4628 RepID=A0AAQ3K417_9LILI|nr:golgin candidate 4 [Canna indica]